ncbi:MAG: hypothetical protein IJT40_03490, partial [Firmicutes bacterium]|nr:hypothetical protein [Bacillota bacterium]
MQMGKNRRLANVKTRRETGLDYVLQNLIIETPFGKKEQKALKPFYPGDEEALRAELDRVGKLVDYIKDNKRTIEILSEVFMEVKDVARTLEKSGNSVLTVLEIYEVKTLLLLMEKYMKLLQSAEKTEFRHEDHHCCEPGETAPAEQVGGNLIPEEYRLRDISDLLDALDPRGDRINTFYIYDEFSPRLGELRQEKRAIEISIRKVQKEKRDEINREYGIMLTPKFDIVVSKSHPKFDIISKIDSLELTDQDYMSATFELKPNEEVFALQQKIEDTVLRIEEEENRICEDLTVKIAKHSADVLYNCETMGRLDFALSKAKFAIKHDCVKPEIVDEH